MPSFQGLMHRPVRRAIAQCIPVCSISMHLFFVLLVYVLSKQVLCCSFVS